MELNKKNKFAENIKNKILNLQEVIEKSKRQKQFMEDYTSKNNLLFQINGSRILILLMMKKILL